MHIDLRLTVRAIAPSQAPAKPCFQPRCCQPLHRQNFFNTLEVFHEYGHYQSNDGTKVNGMHFVEGKHLMNAFRRGEASFPPDLRMKLWKSKVGGGWDGGAIKCAG